MRDRLIFYAHLISSHLRHAVGWLIDEVAGLEAALRDISSALHVLRPDHPLLHLG